MSARPIASELRQLVSLAVPLSVAQLALFTMQLVDTSIVGRSSVEDLAGVALGRSVSFALFAIPMGVSMALEPLAAQAVGAQDHARARGSLATVNRACAFLAVPVFLASLGLTLLLPLVGIEAGMAERARAFLWGNAPAQALFAWFLAQKSYLQSYERTAPPLFAALLGNAVNYVACKVFVLGPDFLPLGIPKLGAFGAGLAASIGTLVLGLVLRVSVKREHARWQDHGIARPSVRHVLGLGFPIALQLLAEIGVFSLAAVLVGRFGAVTTAAHQTALSLASFTFMMTLGVSAATSVRVGLAIGRGERPRIAGLVGMAVGASMMVLGALAFTLAPLALVTMFTSDAGVIAQGVILVRIAAFFQLFDGVQGVAAGALRGAGDVRFAFVANLAGHWMVGLPIALLLAFVWRIGAPGIWWGLTAGLVVVAAATSVRFTLVTRRPLTRV